MNLAYPPLRWGLVLAAMLVYGSIAAPVWSVYESCDVRMAIGADEDLREQTTGLADLMSAWSGGGEEGLPGTPLDADGLARLLARECFEVQGNGTFEISVELTSEDPSTAAYLELQPAIVELGFGGQSDPGPEPVFMLVGSLYRETFVNPQWDGPTIGVIFHADLEAQAQDDGLNVQDVDFGAMQIVWTARRVRQGPCFMKAGVWGDVSGIFAGDFAFYNFFKEGVKEGMASGTVLDPGSNEVLGGLTDFAGWMNDYLEDDGDEEEDEPPNSGSGSGTDEKPESQLIWGEEWDLSGNDNFGLSLVDVKFDSEGPAKEGPAGFADAVGLLGSSFSLAASGSTEWSPGNGNPEEDGGSIFKVNLSSFIVAPGAMDANFSGVKFIWKPGQPGNGQLEFSELGIGVIKGVVWGNLYTEKPYQNGRRLKIRVRADFVALEGALSCQ